MIDIPSPITITRSNYMERARRAELWPLYILHACRVCGLSEPENVKGKHNPMAAQEVRFQYGATPWGSIVMRAESDTGASLESFVSFPRKADGTPA